MSTSESSNRYPFLDASFLEAMNDIGRYGHEKYGEDSFHHRATIGDRSRGTLTRTHPEEIERHASQHFKDGNAGVLHDHFGTRKHQYAASAFNAMMEFYFAGLELEKEKSGG